MSDKVVVESVQDRLVIEPLVSWPFQDFFEGLCHDLFEFFSFHFFLCSFVHKILYKNSYLCIVIIGKLDMVLELEFVKL